MSKQVTIKMVAESANTSPSTVSRVMNNSVDVLPETRQRVLAAVQRLGYSFISKNKRRTIGVILSDTPNIGPYQSSMLTEIIRIFSAKNYRLEIISPKDLNLLNERVIAGAISIFCSYAIERLWHEQTMLPLVRINGAGLKHSNVCSVAADGLSAANLCIERLWRAGHRQIGFMSDISKKSELKLFTRRYEGFCQEMRRRGVNDPERYAAFCDGNGLLSGIKRILDAGCTAAICVNGSYGPQAVKFIKKLGRCIPDDFSLISWEYPGVSEFLDPAHTSCVPKYSELAQKTFDILNNMIDGKDCPDETLIPFELIERDSIAAPSSPVAVEYENGIRRKILDALKEKDLSRREIAVAIGITPQNGNFLRQLSSLRNAGLIQFSKPDKPRSCTQKLKLSSSGNHPCLK